MLLRGDTIHAIYVRRFVCKLHSVKMDTLVSILCKYLEPFWYRFNSFPRGFGPYRHDRHSHSRRFISHTYVVKTTIPPHPKGAPLDWDLLTAETVGNSELIVMLEKPFWDDLSFVTQHVILLLEAAARRWVHRGHRGRGQQHNSGKLWYFKKVQLKQLTQGMGNPYFHVCVKFWP